MDGDTKQKIQEIYDKFDAANDTAFYIWKNGVLFTWEWWVGLALFIIPWIFWLLYRKKNSSCRLLFAGFVILSIASWLDFIGIALGLWYYPVYVIPSIPSYEMWDFSLLPVWTMFLLQYKPHIHPFIKASIFSGVSAFIGEPVFHWMGFYVPQHWKYIYSFPILMLMYFIAYYVSTRKSFEPLQ